MPNKTITVTQRDIRETMRMIAGIDQEVQTLKEERQSEGTPRIIRDISESAVASDSVVSVTEITNPTMIWDDADRGWGYSEWSE